MHHTGTTLIYDFYYMQFPFDKKQGLGWGVRRKQAVRFNIKLAQFWLYTNYIGQILREEYLSYH